MSILDDLDDLTAIAEAHNAIIKKDRQKIRDMQEQITMLSEKIEDIGLAFAQLNALVNTIQTLTHLLSDNTAQDALELCKLDCRVDELERVTGLDQ